MKSKSFFGIFLAMAAVPLVLAYLVLKMGWYTPAATNKGQFLQSEIVLPIKTESPMWSIVYQPKNTGCDQFCEEQLYGLNQTYLALGKLQKRVNAWVLTNEMPLQDYPATKAYSASNKDLDSEHIYVIDPMGKVILKYPGSQTREITIRTSKDILSDLKKLLNYARIG
ncbi:transmembrane cytochrome oxidase associated protein [Psychrosphaera sp.]|nr:transmembrane cytochrome oxidase associated protein [Psychrosphaera sp.]